MFLIRRSRYCHSISIIANQRGIKQKSSGCPSPTTNGSHRNAQATTLTVPVHVSTTCAEYSLERRTTDTYHNPTTTPNQPTNPIHHHATTDVLQFRTLRSIYVFMKYSSDALNISRGNCIKGERKLRRRFS